jgi:hypothetical protein
MNLEECLFRVPEERLKRLAHRYGVGEGIDVPLAIAALAARLLDEAALADALAGLTGEEATALKIIAFACGGKGVVVEQCHQKLNRMTKKWRRNGALVIDALMQRGLVYIDRAHYRQIYFIPTDLRELVLPLVGGDMVKAVITGSIDTVEAGEDPNLAIRTLHFLLSYIKKSGVRLTQNGEVFRRSQKGLAETLGINEQDGVSHGDRPAHLLFLLDYLKSRGLVRRRDGALTIAPENLDGWMNTSSWSKRLDIFNYWQDNLLDQDSDFGTILGFLDFIPDGKWALVDRLITELEPVGMSHSWQALPLRLEKLFFSHLSQAGIVAIGRAGEQMACRLTPVGRQVLRGGPPLEQTWENSFFVQPNFEVLVPRDVHPRVLWMVERVADLTKHDQVMVYILTGSSMYRALKDGMSADDVLKFLAGHSKNRVPQNVEFSIMNWCARFGRMHFVNVLLLHCDTPELAAEIQSVTALKEFIVGAYANVDLAIDRERSEEFVEALQNHGFMPLPGIMELHAGRKAADS